MLSLTSMVPFLRFNLAETTYTLPPQGEGQARQEPKHAGAQISESSRSRS